MWNCRVNKSRLNCDAPHPKECGQMKVTVTQMKFKPASKTRCTVGIETHRKNIGYFLKRPKSEINKSNKIFSFILLNCTINAMGQNTIEAHTEH